MRGELVAIDLETTGLDHTQDEMIEVGAVRMVDGEITGEFTTLINPGIPVPMHTSHITGIRTEDVSLAPRAADVLPRISEFVGNARVIAHNISLDQGFMTRYGILKDNLWLDTYDLSSILLPRAPRYNLNSLTAEVGIPFNHAHRALDDARAAAMLYWKLWERALELPVATVQEIVEAARGFQWSGRDFFEAVLRSHRDRADIPQKQDALFAPYSGQHQPLTPKSPLQKIDPGKPLEIIGDQGTLSHALESFEQRPQQVQMAAAVTEAFNQGRHLLVEAGTGTGKSMAYLVPAVLWATANQDHVLISTNTINLQDQLIEQDIPALKQVVDVPFEAVVLKGRSNYLCPRRLATIRRRRPTSLDELRTLAKILVWLLESKTGDRGEISLRGPVENTMWQRLSAEDEGCTLHRCEATMQGGCPYYKARRSAEAAHLLIVNHALLISDAETGSRVLPEYRYAVIDEAHQLEEAITGGMTFRIDQNALLRRLADLGGPSAGLLGDMLSRTRSIVPDKDYSRLELFVQAIHETTSVMQAHIERFYAKLSEFLADIHQARAGDFTILVRITAQHRSRASFVQLQAVWSVLAEFFDVLSDAMRRLTRALSKLEKYEVPGYEDFVFSAETAAEYLDSVGKQLASFVTEPDAKTVYWVGLGQGAHEVPSVNIAPLHVGPLVEEYLWQRKETVVLTSATLRTGDNFNYIRERLHAEDVEAVDVGSPFDYSQSTLIYLPQDIPEPNDRSGYQRAVERGLIDLAAALDGRVLALFTSYTHLRQTSQAISPRLALGGITVYDQSDGSSRQSLLEGFRSTEKAVLMGTRSFWEGIDIPGDALSALVITRLPFAVPTDPVFSARSETYANAFEDFAVPDAVLRFRQGFGRLIRRQSDRGIVTVFDSRIINKRYGSVFLGSLPECTVQQGPLSGLADAARQWLANDRPTGD
jgi:ATP-dependent DNA helicase DinG